MELRYGLLGILLFFNKNYGTQDAKDIPTKEKIMVTGHLTVALYSSALEYKKKPLVPKASTFKECLEKHILLTCPWIHEKKFLNDLENAKIANKSKKDIQEAIKKNKNYQAITEMAQQLLLYNLTQAFKDCSCYKTSHL